jgi:zinc protease
MKRARGSFMLAAALAAASAGLGAGILGGCASAPPAAGGKGAPFPLASMGPGFGSGGLSAFAKESLPTFSTYLLSNGLPVIVKRETASRVQHLSLVIRGGSAAALPGKAGIEALALKVMARGSAKYAYADIQALLDETSSALGSGSNFDYSSYGLTTLDKYFDRLFPLWADTIVAPSFAQADFDQELSNARLALQSKEQNPWAKTGLVANGIFFAGHPYAASPDGSPESLAGATLGDLREWYASRLRADGAFVVAVGDFDPAALRAKLEAGLGKLPASGAPRPAMVPPIARRGAGSLEKVEFPQSKGMGYLRGDFPAPAPAEADYMPLSLGTKLLTDLLFNVVRDKHGAVYSPSAFIRSFEANYGTIALFKSANPGKAKAYVDEAAAILAAGRAVSVDPASSKDGYAPIAEVLEAAKAQFVNELYESQATNASIAGRIAGSAVSTGDYRSYLLDVDRVRAATVDQVRAALDKYILKGSISWVVLGSPEVLIPAQEVDFAGFGGR